LSSEAQAVRVLDVSAEEDLSPFAAYLAEHRVPHRIFEESGRLVVAALPVHAEAVRACYSAWRAGKLELERAAGPSHPPMLPRVRQFLLTHPGLAALLVATFVLFPATWGLDDGEVSKLFLAMTITPVSLVPPDRLLGTPLAETFASGQLWRLITPVFLHFGPTHLLFNVALVTEFGRRIEQICGTWLFLALVASVAVVSNLAQFLSTAGLFGGLSGVAYGLFAFVVVRGRLAPEVEAWHVHRSFVIGVVVFLVLMSSGITSLFGLHIANAAHWAGLILGGVIAWASGRRST
jgi:GlpG protein